MKDNSRGFSSLSVKSIPSRDVALRNGDMWLDDKRAQDGAEGLWRVYDNLYDLNDYMDKHPGGKFWLEATKGTDITEAFEAHHISTVPERILKRHFVRQAKTSRNSPFTLEENGFYKTLKRNVREALKTIPKGDDRKSELITDSLLVASLVSATAACYFWSYAIAAFSGLLFCCLVIASHNYYHRRDNFRMYYSDIAMLSSREARIFHILSHHMYTNTIADLQAFTFEPMLNFYPEPKSTWARYGSWLYTPLFMWPTTFYLLFIVRMYQPIILGKTEGIVKSDSLNAVLPITMYIFGGQPLWPTIGMLLVILSIYGFCFGVIGTATTHFHPDIFIDGDKPRPEDQRDWGINQLDTVSDRREVTGNLLLVLVTFGDHALHHLFPTFDHGVLHHLYPVVEKTMKEFNLNIRMTSSADMVGGYFRQLAREKRNPNSPNLAKG